MKTRVTELLGIEKPVIQGGLAYLAEAALAAAVSNAGGLGQITATTLSDESALKREIDKFRSRSQKPFGVNLALGHRPIEGLLKAALDEGATIISLTGGNPAPYVETIKAAGARLMVLVAGTRAARKAEDLGADVIIAVGQEGGGHLGRNDLGTFILTRKICQTVSVPVVASGGIGDGAGLVAALALGAEAIEMGTRFVATAECIAHPRYKEALMTTEMEETQVIERSVGRPGRVLPSDHVRKILELEAQGADFNTLLPYISGEANQRSAVFGEVDRGFAWAGQVVALIHDVPTVQELVDRIMDEARQALERLNGRFG